MLTKPNPASTTLYSAPQEMESHAVRFIMAHKSIEGDVLEVDLMSCQKKFSISTLVKPCQPCLTGAWFYMI
jgi:hypothetical protein